MADLWLDAIPAAPESDPKNSTTLDLSLQTQIEEKVLQWWGVKQQEPTLGDIDVIGFSVLHKSGWLEAVIRKSEGEELVPKELFMKLADEYRAVIRWVAEDRVGTENEGALERVKLKEDIERLTSELRAREEEYEQKIATLEQKAKKGPEWAEMDELEMENLTLKREIKGLKAEAGEVEKRGQESAKKPSFIEDDVDQFDDVSLTSKKGGESDLQDRCKMLEQANAALREDKEELQRQVDVLTQGVQGEVTASRLPATEQRQGLTDASRLSRSDQEAAMQMEIASLTQERDDLLEDVEQLRRDLSAALTRETELRSAAKEKLTHDDAEAVLCEEKANLENALQKTREELAGVRQILGGRHERVAELEGEITLMRAREARVKEENLRMEKEKAALERENGGLIAGQARLRKELETAKFEARGSVDQEAEATSDFPQSDASQASPKDQPVGKNLSEELEAAGQDSSPSSLESAISHLQEQKGDLDRELEELREHIKCLRVVQDSTKDYNELLEQHKHFLDDVDPKILDIARVLLQDRTAEEAKAFLKRRRLADDYVRDLWQEVDKVRLESTTLSQANEAATKRIKKLEEQLSEVQNNARNDEPVELTGEGQAEYARLEGMIDKVSNKGLGARLDKFLAEQDQRRRNAEVAEREGQRMLNGERAVDMAAIDAIYAYGLPADE